MNALPPEFESFLRPEDDDDSTRALPQPEDADATAVIANDPAESKPRPIPVIPAPGRAATPPAPPPNSPRAAVPPAVPPPVTPGRTPPGPAKKPPGRKSGKRKRRWLRWVVLALVAYFVSLAALFMLSVNRIDALPPTSSVNTSGKNVLIVGSDSRAGLTAEQQEQLTTGSVEGDRTDAIMLLHIPTFGTPTLVSIPRDSWVPIPGFGNDKINAAYALGGPELLIETVEQVTGLQVTDFVAIGFAGIANTTDALGGVTLCPVQDFNDEFSGLNVVAGCQTMDGPTALAYVRMRYADPRGDLGRVERQQEFVSAVGKKALSPLTWMLPWRSYPTAYAAGESLTVSRGTNIFDITRIGIAMGMLSLGWGTSTTVPTEEGTFDVDGQSALKWDSAQARELFASLE
ncbi:MAG: LCP family protein [Actinobacteria bacterium]|nr:LCP family protein [Actinomycetota bacterium]MCB9413543.1 LCP family protein [Actinomycetota bacterium]